MTWYQILIVFMAAFLTTWCMVPVSKKLAVKLGAIDYPGWRRVNFQPMPRCGGIALYCGFLVGVLTFYLGTRFFGWEVIDLYTIRGINYAVLFIGISAMFGLGLVDDITQIKPAPKLIGQIVAAIVIALSGVTIASLRSPLSGDYLMLGWADIPLTVIYLVVFVNITNLIDGLDGLAAGIVAIVAFALLYLCGIRGSYTLMAACVALIAVCAAFLRFNFYPASIFMGDSGSLLLGVLLGVISILGVVRTQSLVIMLVPIIIAGVPVIDTVSAVFRRRRASVPIDEADLGHVHHRLLRSGFGQRRSVAVLWLCSAAMAVAGCIIGTFSGPVRWAVFLVLGVAVFLVIWDFGLFKPVLRHHYDNQGKTGPRRDPRSDVSSDAADD